MTTAESVLFNAIAVINLEGDLLDQGEFDAWLDLWQHDGLYVVPIDPTETDFKNTLNYACDDHEMRAKRVKRLVEAGVIEPTEARQNPRQRYRLAAKGRRAKRG